MKGADRGKSGKVIRALPRELMVVVEGLNQRKKTVKPKKQGEAGEIVSVPSPIRVENVALICRSCGKPTRVSYRLSDSGKVRYCKKCQTPN